MKRYLIESQSPHPDCMKCHAAWPLSFMQAEFETTWLNGTYWPHQARVIYDIEKQRLPDTQIFYQIMQHQQACKRALASCAYPYAQRLSDYLTLCTAIENRLRSALALPNGRRLWSLFVRAGHVQPDSGRVFLWRNVEVTAALPTEVRAAMVQHRITAPQRQLTCQVRTWTRHGFNEASAGIDANVPSLRLIDKGIWTDEAEETTRAGFERLLDCWTTLHNVLAGFRVRMYHEKATWKRIDIDTNDVLQDIHRPDRYMNEADIQGRVRRLTRDFLQAPGFEEWIKTVNHVHQGQWAPRLDDFAVDDLTRMVFVDSDVARAMAASYVEPQAPEHLGRVEALMGIDPSTGGDRICAGAMMIIGRHPCPWPECRGFVAGGACGLCARSTCDRCWCPVPEDADHVCRPEDVESVRVIRNGTKPCPSCAVPIQRSEGCAQMWCTHCNSAFDWTTLRRIANRDVHNPHYFDWLRTQEPAPAPAPVPDPDPTTAENNDAVPTSANGYSQRLKQRLHQTIVDRCRADHWSLATRELLRFVVALVDELPFVPEDQFRRARLAYFVKGPRAMLKAIQTDGRQYAMARELRALCDLLIEDLLRAIETAPNAIASETTALMNRFKSDLERASNLCIGVIGGGFRRHRNVSLVLFRRRLDGSLVPYRRYYNSNPTIIDLQGRTLPENYISVFMEEYMAKLKEQGIDE